MKKVKFEGKLSLNKKTVANLNDTQMVRVRGGYGEYAAEGPAADGDVPVGDDEDQGFLSIGGPCSVSNNCPGRQTKPLFCKTNLCITKD